MNQLHKFTTLRVYKHMTTLNILNSMICNRIMKSPTLVKNSRAMYEFSSKILGKKIVNWFVTLTFCKTLTAGNSLTEANQISDYFRNESNTCFILRYSRHP